MTVCPVSSSVLCPCVLFPELPCDLPPEQTNGHHDVCVSPFKFGSVCSYECDIGYSLPSGGVHTVHCVSSTAADGQPATEWDTLPAACTGRQQDG